MSDSSSAAPLVSVVIPFRNESPFLGQSVESVLGQTYPHFELLLVDNASTDGSEGMADDYARRDVRVRVIHHRNPLSQLANFNFGLGQIDSGSRYVKMVFGDDWIFPECLDRMVALGESQPTVAIVGSYYVYWDHQVFGHGLPYPSLCVPGREICRLQLLQDRFFFGSPSALLYRAEVVRTRLPFFTESSPHADTEAAYELLEHYDFGFVHQLLSFIRFDNNSTLSRVETYDWGYLDKYIITRKYGPRFLTGAECRRVRRTWRRLYHRALGEAFLLRREPAYWAYHRRGLASLGESLGPIRLLGGAALALGGAVRHPRRALRKVRDRQGRS